MELALSKRLHQRATLFPGKAAVNLAHAIIAEARLHFLACSVDTDELVRRGDRRTHDERPALCLERPLDLAKHRGALCAWDHLGGRRNSPRRLRIDRRELEPRVENQRKASRNRRRGHDEKMRPSRRAACAEPKALCDPEAMLLVDDDQTEVGEANLPAQKRMRSHDEVEGSRGHAIEHRAALILAQRAGEHAKTEAELLGRGPQGLRVLVGEQLGRRQEHGLCAASCDLRAGHHRHGRLAATHVALKQTPHRRLPRQ